MPNIIDITGQKFNRLTAIKRTTNKIKHGHKRVMFLFKCDCGNDFISDARSVRRGHTLSCGCAKKDHLDKVHKINTIHGEANTKLYKTWRAIHRRCYKKDAHEYPRYGGRGILVCERWNSYDNFKSDMGQPPTKWHSIDRIDGTKGYSPDNCRWATPAEQAANRNFKVWRSSNAKVEEVNPAELSPLKN